MPGTPYIPERVFDAAIEEGKLSTAWRAAQNMPHVTLDRALQLTIVMAVEEDPGTAAAIRRFIVRFIREWDPAPKQISNLADALETLERQRGLADDARDALEDLARRLAEGRECESWPPDPMTL